MITATPAVEAAIADNKSPILLVEIQFSTVTVRSTTNGYDINWDGKDWLSNGFITAPPDNSVQRELRSSSDQISLTGVDLTIAAIVLNESQNNRQVTVYEAFLDDAGQIIPDPFIRDVYFIDQVAIRMGTDTASVTLTLAGEFADFEFKSGIRTTDNSLQRFHPGDELMKFATEVKKEQRWGGE